MEFPTTGLPADQIRELLAVAAEQDHPWRTGRGWSLVYDLPGAHGALIGEASERFRCENALSDSAFPSAGRFESAVIDMVSSIVCPGSPGHGVFTSGGTESIFVALRAYRDRAQRTHAEVVVPDTAHPAFGKSAQFLGMPIRRVPVGPSGAVDADVLEQALSPDTVMIGLSAPNFPYGALDPVAAVATLAQARGIGLHVDAALGGMFLPFLPDRPSFGLDVPGVTSVSVDLHKYGYAAKGASVVLFATQALRHASYYLDSTWPGGAYASAGLLGTRPVGPAAAAYASLLALGQDGFQRLTDQVMAVTRSLQQGLNALGPFTLVGQPVMGVFAVTGPAGDVNRLAAGLARRGWRMDSIPRPPALHFVVMPRHTAVVMDFLADAAASLGDAADAYEISGTYGVMVRGERPSRRALQDHLDRRFDGGALLGSHGSVGDE